MQGEALKSWRIQQGWTLQEAARYLGATKTSVHRWEAGRHKIPQTVVILTYLLCENKNIRKVQDFLYKQLVI